MAAPLSARKRAAIVRDIKAVRDGQLNLSRNAIARKHGVALSTVGRICEQDGLKEIFDRTSTQNATVAKVADLAAMRADLAKLLLQDAYELRERARNEYSYYERGQMGPELVTLERPPLRETREAYTALGIAIDKSKHLIQQDTDVSGATAVDAWLRDMIGDAATSAAQPA